jgi:hypothetical protein
VALELKTTDSKSTLLRYCPVAEGPRKRELEAENIPLIHERFGSPVLTLKGRACDHPFSPSSPPLSHSHSRLPARRQAGAADNPPMHSCFHFTADFDAAQFSRQMDAVFGGASSCSNGPERSPDISPSPIFSGPHVRKAAVKVK